MSKTELIDFAIGMVKYLDCLCQDFADRQQAINVLERTLEALQKLDKDERYRIDASDIPF